MNWKLLWFCRASALSEKPGCALCILDVNVAATGPQSGGGRRRIRN